MSESNDAGSILHRIRSGLATLRTDLELAAMDKVPPSTEAIAAVDRILQQVSRLEDIELEAAAPPTADLGGGSAGDLSQGRVFVIDDDARHAELVGRRLRRLGFEVTSGGDLATVAPTLGASDSLVVDLGCLEGIDDWTAASVRAANTVVMSGAVDKKAPRRAEELGANGYLVKPVRIEELAEMLRPRLPEADPET